MGHSVSRAMKGHIFITFFVAMFLLVWTTTTTTTTADCPDGWEVKPEFGKCYYYIDEGMTWSEANNMCKAFDLDGVATLTAVRSQAENDYVFSLMGGGWIGGTDQDEEGVWRWVEDGSLVDDGSGSFTNWGEDEPDNGEDYNCMSMYSGSGTWYDTNCDYTLRAVCSKPIAA